MLLKATQQALQIPGLARPMRFKREENCREQAALLHMISDYEMKLARDLDDAQQELAGIIRCFQDPNEDADEELRDFEVRAWLTVSRCCCSSRVNLRSYDTYISLS